MIRSYALSVLLLFASVTSLRCMQIPGAQLPTVSVLDVIKNDVCSGELLVFSALRAPLIIGAVALLKISYQGGVSSSELCEGVMFATAMGSCLWPLLVAMGGLFMPGNAYNEADFVRSEKSFKVRSGLRWLFGACHTFMAFRQLQGLLERESTEFFIKHPSLMALR